MQNIDPTLLSFLQEHTLGFEYYEHTPVFTVAQGESIKTTIACLHTKNLFLTDKRGQYRLVCIESSKRLPINYFRKLVGAKDMTFGTPEEMKELLQLTPGSVSIFGLIHRPANLSVYLDHDVRTAQKIGRHPNRNDATIVINNETLVRYLEIVGVEVKVVVV